MSSILVWCIGAIVLLGVVPTVVAVTLFCLASVHRWFDHLDGATSECLPRVAILIPAWNEELVLRYSIDRLLALDYPAQRLRVVVVDDASTDGTAELMRAKVREHGDRLLWLRREDGGQGKAHTVNHGLAQILADSWAQAVLLTDADVVFEAKALRRMTRHLADPAVGAVTAYIREASAPPGLVNSYVAFEYAVAQCGARRASDVIAVHACLAGGAQLHRRENLERLGGQIDTSTLAEDTVTTFQTQLDGARVVFEPHAVALAEEPDDIGSLWRQRLRWARGNLQVTRRFRHVFFHPRAHPHLGNPLFGLAWFSLLLLPAWAVLCSLGLVGLWLADVPAADGFFRFTWAITALGAVFVTLFGLALDPVTARRSWPHALTFNGLVNLLVMVWAVAPVPMRALAATVAGWLGLTWDDSAHSWLTLAVFVWVGACIPAAWTVYRLERIPAMRRVARVLLVVVGYGPLLCAVIWAAYLAELRGVPARWDKTVKVGKIEAVAGV